MTWDWGEFLGWCIMIMMVLAVVAVMVGLAFLMVTSVLKSMRQEPPVVESKTYNGTLGMFSYGYSWCGLGHVESTRLTFVDGQVFSFSGELQVVIGQRYVVQYDLVTYYDNSTRVEPKTVMQVWEGM